MESQNIFLLNDSYPPIIDGVANAVVNYAAELQSYGQNPFVFAPDMPGMDDSASRWPVIRYPSIDTEKLIGYTVGVPLTTKIPETVNAYPPAIIHCHCPSVSLAIGRVMRMHALSPLVYTYHSKYDVEIRRMIQGKLVQDTVIKAMVDLISTADEVWTVSKGAGENLRSLGFKGDYIIMDNGVDVEKKRAPEAEIQKISEEFGLMPEEPVLLFVGRMQWYKGQRIILDAAKRLALDGQRFRLIFVGGGQDFDEIRAYSDSLDLGNRVIFTGPVRDREKLRAFYSRADLFLFPSVFDTNGLVVREAAASSLASVLVKGSCPAEGVTDDRNGFLIDENAESMYEKLKVLLANRDHLREVGQNAADELYISWHTAVGRALERYAVVAENYREGRYKPHTLPDAAMAAYRKLTELVNRIRGEEE